MGKSKLQKGWGTLFVVISMLMISSCAERKSAHESETSFDFFTEECHPADQSGIVNGSVVQPSSIQSTKSVLLISKNAEGKQSICSSTLISEQVLLTAAHCVNEAVQIQAIFFADVSCSSGYKRSAHAITAQKFVHHPQYNKNIESVAFLDENPDLGLVYLAHKAPTHFSVFRIHDNPESLQSNVTLYGFGVTGMKNKDAMVMRTAEVARENLFFHNKALFYDQHNKAGVCSGDSGGAGLMKNELDQEVVVSVNSEVFSVDGAEDDLCQAHSKSIVVRHYLDWINSVMSQWGESLK